MSNFLGVCMGRITTVVMCVFGLSACGGGGSSGVIASPEGMAIQGDVNGIATTPSTSPNPSLSPSGTLRRGSMFRSKTNIDISAINQLFAAHPEVSVTRCFADIP